MESHNNHMRSLRRHRACKPLHLSMLGAILITLCASMLWSSSAFAQACCTATGGGEFGVVGRCHQSVVALQTTYEPTLGTYDSKGEYRAFKNTSLHDVVLSLGAGSRFGTRRFQAHSSIPLRLQYRQLPGMESATGLGLGDAKFGLRWTFLEDPMVGMRKGELNTYLPFLDGYVQLMIPSGRAPESSNNPIGADITGNGHWGILAGLKAVKFLTYRHVAGLYLEYGHLFARTIERRGTDVAFKPGSELGAGLTYMNIHSVYWSWGGSVAMRFGGNATLDNRIQLASATQRLQVGAHITRNIAFPFWEVTLSATNDAWTNKVAKNLPFVGPSVSFDIKRNFL